MTKILPYESPPWVQRVKNIPKGYIQLARRPTPIQRWNLPGVPSAFRVSIKRDDLTGSTLSGNKIRVLEFLLADAVRQGYDSIVTCGGIQSNHCRATAVAAKQVQDSECCVANVALDRLAGAQVYLVPKESLDGGLWKRLLKLADRLCQLISCQPKNDAIFKELDLVYKKEEALLPFKSDARRTREEKKEKAYPIGGSNHIGTFGYIEAFQEMMNQNVLEEFDDIVMAVGGGGTVSGIGIGNYLTGSKLKVHGVVVSGSADHYYGNVQKIVDSFGLEGVKARDIVDLIEGYIGVGYAQSTNEELEQLIEISQSTGILLDSNYNLKAVRGMLAEMDNNPTRLKGSRVLYIHTGGIFSLFDHRLQPLLLNQVKEGKQIFKIWNSGEDDPLAI